MASTTGKEATPGSTMVESSTSVVMEAKFMLASGHEDCQKLKDLLNKEDAAPMVAVVEFSRAKEPSNSAAGSKKGTSVTMDARLMVSTGHGECNKLKNLMGKDSTVTVVATVSRDQASEAKPALTSVQLRLLAAASEGDLEELTSLLSRTGDVEEGNNAAAPSASAASLVESVTVEGDTALHLVAANGAYGNREECEACVKFIHEKDKSLLSKQNNKGDTPLHCAIRAGRSQLVSCLIGLAQHDGTAQALLRMENNNNETALHEAVRRGDKKMVTELLRADRKLASFPTNGTSPLYLAIQLIDDTAILWEENRQEMKRGGGDLLKYNKKKSMAQTLHDESEDGFLSYLGPKGQNALHAGVVRGPVITRKLLRLNKDLTIQRDENGSTPLHFAAGLRGALRRGSVCSQVFDANPDALFQLDNNGLSPIHVAASVGVYSAITLFVKKCPGTAGLRDAKGRTFLHVAVENKEAGTVYVCMNPWLARIWYMQECLNRSQLAWIINMQDNAGNTALHLAVRAGRLIMFSALFGNQKADFNITNAEGQTPLDIATYKVPPGIFYNQNSEERIRRALIMAGARSGASRRDHFQENYQGIHGVIKSDYESKELENLRDTTQTQSIVSVLIATVAFGATFALPGGYRADDHTNGGTPTLAGRYAFDGFMMANTLAFIFSAATIICLVRGGSPMFNRVIRVLHTSIAYNLMEISVTCLIAAFALGVFVVLSPVAPKTARAICVMSGIIYVLCKSAEFWLKWLFLVPSFCVRKGLPWTSYKYTKLAIGNTLFEYWPFLLIFIWAAYGRTHPISKE